MPEKTIEYGLRAAKKSDYDFVKGLYVATMEPLLTALDAWNTERNIASFNQTYRVGEASIVVVAGKDIGWFQLHPGKNDLSLHQIHLKPGYHNRRIGTHIIEALIRRAETEGKKLTLSVVRGNRALRLYRRLGFAIIDEDDTKFHLSR